MMTLSPRGQSNASQRSIPWRFALFHTYDLKTNPSGLISLATAENWLVQKELRAFASRTPIPSAAFRYSYSMAGGPRLPSAFARHVNEYFAPYWRVSGEDISITAAATSLHDLLAFSLCEEGEGIMTSRPYYGRFEIDLGNKAGVKLVAADTDHEDCFGEDVVDAFEKKLIESEDGGTKIRAILIVNSHNPLGQCEICCVCNKHADQYRQMLSAEDAGETDAFLPNPQPPPHMR